MKHEIRENWYSTNYNTFTVVMSMQLIIYELIHNNYKEINPQNLKQNTAID